VSKLLLTRVNWTIATETKRRDRESPA
jgi:hypothetical protein